jgi:hypothetical protein
MGMQKELDPKRKPHLLRLLALASFGAGFLTYLQLMFPLKGLAWDFIWLVLITTVEWIADPLWKNVKMWKRVLVAVGALAVVLAFTAGLLRVTRQFGVNQFYVAPTPWFLTGFIFLIWSLLIHADTLPD